MTHLIKHSKHEIHTPALTKIMYSYSDRLSILFQEIIPEAPTSAHTRISRHNLFSLYKYNIFFIAIIEAQCFIGRLSRADSNRE